MLLLFAIVMLLRVSKKTCSIDFRFGESLALENIVHGEEVMFASESIGVSLGVA
jgi:hypothetical protein